MLMEEYCTTVPLAGAVKHNSHSFTFISKAVISLENTQIRRYALEPAGTFIFRCWSLFSDGV